MSIKKVLKNDGIYHHYQPIFDIKGSKKLGYEGLLRSEHYRSPEIMLSFAKKERQLYDLDSRSIHKAIQTFSTSNQKGKLFLNILPSTIAHSKFPSFVNKIMSENMLSSQQVIFEVNEAENFLEMKEFKNGIKELKDNRFSIALDDVGSGFGDLKAIIEMEPKYVKLDRYFSDHIQTSKKKQTIVQHLANYCQENESNLILEGIETVEEMNVAKELGVTYAQGYYLGRPNKL